MRVLALLLAFLAGPAWAQAWKLDYGKSQIRYVIKQMNVPVEGGFRRFNTVANFTPDKIEAGQFRVELDMLSADTGSAEGDAESRRPVWFDTARFPRAVFASKALRKLADGRYVAQGELSLKGQSRGLEVPFTLSRQAGGAWLAEGRFPLRRSDFGIGGGEWNDVVDDLADVRFRLWLTP